MSKVLIVGAGGVGAVVVAGRVVMVVVVSVVVRASSAESRAFWTSSTATVLISAPGSREWELEPLRYQVHEVTRRDPPAHPIDFPAR